MVRYRDIKESLVLEVSGLSRSVDLLYVTDTHAVLIDERDGDRRACAERERARITRPDPPASSILDSAVASVRAGEVEVVVLGGDILHFPTVANLELLAASLEALGERGFFVMGNHDWLYPDEPYDEETRAMRYPLFRSLLGHEPAFRVLELDEVRLLGLDNSVYEVSDAQLELLANALRDGKPSLLFLHVPVLTPALAPLVIEHKRAPIVMGASAVWRKVTPEMWRATEPSAATRELCRLLVSPASESILAILAGHLHFTHASEYRPGRRQFISPRSSSRAVRLLPA